MSIKCPTCKVENKDGAKFCKECGCSFASLISCPACHALIKPGRFCASCGHSFAAPAPKTAEIPASETSTSKPDEESTVTPIDISLTDIAEPVRPPAPIEDHSSTVVRPDQTPMAQVPEATPGVETSPPPAEQPPQKTHFKIAYALVPLAVIVALGGAYWWKSNHAETASASAPAATPAPVATTPANPVTPAPAPTMPAPAPEPVPVAKTAPAVPTEPTKVPTTTVKPVAAEKGPVAEKPAAPRPQIQTPGTTPTTGNAHSALRTQAPNTAAPVKSLDETYNERITAECPQGFFPGMACREKVRWEMCEGKWAPDAIPGQATCKGTGAK